MCPVCFNLLWKPVECQNCRKIFCKRCSDKCLKEKPGVCPFGKQYREDKCSPILHSILCKFKITCENMHNGCDGVLLYESLEKDQKKQCE